MVSPSEAAGAGAGVAAGGFNIGDGLAWSTTKSCACITVYHPESPYLIIGIVAASAMIGLALLIALGPRRWAGKATWGIVIAVVASFLAGDQFWGGAILSLVTIRAGYVEWRLSREQTARREAT